MPDEAGRHDRASTNLKHNKRTEKMAEESSNNPEEILGTYKRMLAECQQIASKISEVRK
jgi:hypothetical protein